MKLLSPTVAEWSPLVPRFPICETWSPGARLAQESFKNGVLFQLAFLPQWQISHWMPVVVVIGCLARSLGRDPKLLLHSQIIYNILQILLLKYKSSFRFIIPMRRDISWRDQIKSLTEKIENPSTTTCRSRIQRFQVEQWGVYLNALMEMSTFFSKKNEKSVDRRNSPGDKMLIIFVRCTAHPTDGRTHNSVISLTRHLSLSVVLLVAQKRTEI